MSNPKYPEEDSLVVVRAANPSRQWLCCGCAAAAVTAWPMHTHPCARTHAHTHAAAGVLTLEFKLSSAVRLPTEEDLISHADFEYPPVVSQYSVISTAQQARPVPCHAAVVSCSVPFAFLSAK